MEGRTTRFCGPRAFPVESLEWAGWCRGPKNTDRAQGAPDPLESNLKPLCIPLGWGSSESPSPSFSLGANAVLHCALAPEYERAEQLDAEALRGLASWGGRERGGACGPALLDRVTGLVNPPSPCLTPFHLFPLDSIGVRSSHPCKERPPCPRCNIFWGKALLGQREFRYLRQWSCSWEAQITPISQGDAHLSRGRRGG